MPWQPTRRVMMLEATARARSNKHQQQKMIEQLSVEIMAEGVIKFMDIPTRLKLASCNSLLKRRVYQDCRPAWRHISFLPVDRALSERLTDDDLSTLLTRVNAVDVTQTLDLQGCWKLEGSGFIPFPESRSLEYVNLRSTIMGTNPVPVIWILRTMISHELWLVAFPDECTKDPPNEHVVDFMRDLRRAKYEQAKANDTPCSSCKQQVVDNARQLIPSFFGMNPTRCIACEKHYCRQGTCSIDIRECSVCTETYCEKCARLKRCHYCSKSYCYYFGGDVDCGDILVCDDCEKCCCRNCSMMPRCDNCNDGVCNECSASRVQENCVNGCIMCQHCLASGRCANCSETFCLKCNAEYDFCEICSKKYCPKIDCLRNVTECGACEDTYCKDCGEFEHCLGCDLSYCKKHDRFVDCDACEMRHCRNCKHSRERCFLCGKACFEGCSCNDESPFKKAKIA